MNPEEIKSKAIEISAIEKDSDKDKAIEGLNPEFKEQVLDAIADLKSGEDGADSGDGNDSGGEGGNDGSDDSGEELSDFEKEVIKIGNLTPEERGKALDEFKDNDDKNDLIRAIAVYLKTKEGEGDEDEKTKKQSIMDRLGGFLSGGDKKQNAEVKAEYDKMINEAQNSEAGKNYEDALESLEIATEIAPNKDAKKKAFAMMRAINEILNPVKKKETAGRKPKEITDEDIINDVHSLIVKCEQKEKQNLAAGKNGIRFNRLKKTLKRTLRWIK